MSKRARTYMSDNETEHEGNPPATLAGAEEQPVIAQPTCH